MRHNAVGFVSYDTLNGLNRISGCDDLRESVSMATLAPILMAISLSKLSPSIRKIYLVRRHGGILTGLVVRPGLTPYAYVRVIRLYPRHKIVIIIALVGPHSILDIPNDNLKAVLLLGIILGFRYFNRFCTTCNKHCYRNKSQQLFHNG
jgi:hypothetical protein